MAIDKNIQELLDAEVIDQGTADRITDYYSAKKTNSPNLLLTIFAVLGSFLVGLGIMGIGGDFKKAGLCCSP